MRSTKTWLLFALPVALFGCASGEAAKAYDPGYAQYESYADGAYDDYDEGASGEAGAGMPMAMEPAADAPEGAGGLLALFGGSGGGEGRRGAPVAQARPRPAPPSPPDAPKEEAPEATPSEEPQPAETSKPHKRLVIYTGSLSLLVPNVDPALEKFLARVEELGGYLGSRTENTVTVRVPAASFESLVDETAGMGTVLSRRVQARDVTAEYRDLSIRIENAERSRQRLLSLLERAEKMEDVLKIEAQLTRVTAELESMKGQLRLLADQISLSTLTVEFKSNAPPPRPVHVRRYSRFEWINAVGIENALGSF